MEIKIDTDTDNMDEVMEYMNGPFMMAAIESFRHHLRTLEKHADMTDDAQALFDKVQDLFAQEFSEFIK